MRRPLKPFVTEYKGARRPPSNQPQSLDAFREAEPQAKGFGSSNGASQRSPWPSDADAAFSDRPRPRPVETNTMAEPEDAYEAAMRAADALFARPASAPPPASSPLSEAKDHRPDQSPPARGGRILPVLDEAPSPQLAALEAAYAPKRRGRKPGSKNKPKPDAVKVAKPKRSATIYYNAPAPSETLETSKMTVAEDNSKPVFQAPAIQTLEALSTLGGPRAQRRNGKVGGRVKPGEGWKRRRLPRVCW